MAVTRSETSKKTNAKRQLKRLCLRPLEVSKLVGCDKSTIHRLIDDGHMRAVQPGGPGTAMFITTDEIKRVFGAEVTESVEVRS
jgi:excisionase family DNA binding protein